jgi:hypothetical protein
LDHANKDINNRIARRQLSALDVREFVLQLLALRVIELVKNALVITYPQVIEKV